VRQPERRARPRALTIARRPILWVRFDEQDQQRLVIHNVVIGAHGLARKRLLCALRRGFERRRDPVRLLNVVLKVVVKPTIRAYGLVRTVKTRAARVFAVEICANTRTRRRQFKVFVQRNGDPRVRIQLKRIRARGPYRWVRARPRRTRRRQRGRRWIYSMAMRSCACARLRMRQRNAGRG